jgi:hypothetical protein
MNGSREIDRFSMAYGGLSVRSVLDPGADSQQRTRSRDQCVEHQPARLRFEDGSFRFKV